MFYNDGEEDEESESLILSSTSFSINDWSHEFIDSAETVSGKPTEKEMDNVKNARGLRRCESIAASASALRRMIASTVHGTKVRESFAVVKRTEDPYEDFKRSMLEMILEKQIFETKDLEELLRGCITEFSWRPSRKFGSSCSVIHLMTTELRWDFNCSSKMKFDLFGPY